MENLHLKNLIQNPNGLIILKKLKDIEHNYKNHLPADLIIETANYLETLKFKNRTNTVIFTIKGTDNVITDINNTYC